ncbi:uncharacterized protein LKV04_008373 [Tautogolabrus adspersus]
MVKSCCVLSCKNTFTKDSALHFHRIPRDPETRRKWLSAIRRNNWNPVKEKWICGCHFVSGKRSYDPRHPDYVPSLFQYTSTAGRVQAAKNLKSYLQRKALAKKNLLASTNREVAAMPVLSLQRVPASVSELHNVQFQVIEIQTERAPADIAALNEQVESLNAEVIKEESHDGNTSFHHQLQSLNTEFTGEETRPEITSLHDQTEPLKGGIKTEEEHMDISSSHGQNPSLWAEVKTEETSAEMDSLHVPFESVKEEVMTENHVDIAPSCGQMEPLNPELRTEETNDDVASLHEQIRSLNAECQFLRDKVHRLENMESVQDVIMKAVPRLKERDYLDLITHLAGIGVKTECGDRFFTLKELKDIVALLRGQRLVDVLKNRGCKNVTPGKLGNSKPGSSCLSISPIAPIQSNDWVSSYQVPWEKMGSNLRQCVAQGKRPRKQDHLAMVRVIVDSVRELCLNPSRRQCSHIAKGITDKYPQSFADLTMEGERIGCGYGSLLNRIKTRVEHVNRCNRLVRVRRAKRRRMDDLKPESSTEASASKCSKTDNYGCINWHPLSLPEDQTPELEGKRKAMVTIFSQEGPRAAERDEVEEFMTITYTSQRYAINSNPPPSMDTLKEQWPFLFMKRFMCAHFNTLTGIDINDRLTDSLSSKGVKVLNFFDSQLPRWKPDVRKVLKDIDRAYGQEIDYNVASMLATMAYFKEREDALFLLADICECRVLFILRINPDGSKCQARYTVSQTTGRRIHRKISSLNPHVATLITEIVDFV